LDPGANYLNPKKGLDSVAADRARRASAGLINYKWGWPANKSMLRKPYSAAILNIELKDGLLIKKPAIRMNNWVFGP